MVTPNPPANLAPASAAVSQVTRVERVNAPPPEAHVNPLLRLHLMLYGRYKWAITLGLILGICGSVTTWVLMPPKYEVVGYLQIRPYMNPILVTTPENGMLPMFDTFVSLQVSLLQSQRVLDQASQNSDWKMLGRTSPRWGQKIPADGLTVDHPKGSELVTVSFKDRDPEVALAAVKAILQAYQTTSADVNGDAHQLQILEDLRTSLTNQMRGIADQIFALANGQGSDDLHQEYLFKLDKQNQLDSEIQQLALDISIAQATAGGATPTSSTEPSTQPATQPRPVTITREDVAAIDPQMRTDLAEESRLSLRLDQLRMHMGANNRQILSTQSDLQVLEIQINKRLADYQEKANGSPGSIPSFGGSSKLSLAQLRVRESIIRALFENVQAETKALGQVDLKIRSLKSQEDAISHKLDQTTARIDQINLESTTATRISVLSTGERPSAPLPNKRLPLTTALGLLGLAAGVGLVALRGLADRRVSCLQHMQQLVPAIRVLGMLPVLPDDFAEPAQIALTAHCVHQIRNLLETAPVHDRGRVLAITSPSPGDGKTSLSLALGISFAVSGSRTLLIDCDMVGGGLTSRVNAVNHSRIGSILRRQGLLTDRQVTEALSLAAETHRKLGETLISLGYLKPENLQQALKDQEETSVGLVDALGGEPLAHCIASVLTEGLSILPLGDATAENNSQISAKALRRIIKEARAQFDFIIVDSGPILGSIEASVVAREADEVVLAVTRGSSSPLVIKTVELLASLNARLGGIVFNRATPGDVAYSKYGSSGSLRSFQSSQSQRDSQRSHSEPRRRAGSPPRLGPVAAAVAGIAAPPHVNGKSSNGQAANQEPPAS